MAVDYTWAVLFGDQPTAEYWSILGENDASFHNGLGLPMAGAQKSYVATSEATSSSSYTTLSTAQSVTVDVPANRKALVGVGFNAGNSVESRMTFAVSGASTIAAADKFSISLGVTNTQGMSWFLLDSTDGLNAGSNIFAARFRTGGVSGAFLLRHLIVIPI